MLFFTSLLKARKSILVVACSILFLSIIHQSCKKTDFAVASSDQDFAANFFSPKKPVSEKTKKCIEILRKENERHNFVDGLPKNIGVPVWEKMILRTMQGTALKGYSSEYMVIAFAPNGRTLSGLLIAVPEDSMYTVRYYSNAFLYAACHAPNKNIQQAENLLALFMLMDSYIFDRIDFYHIPVDLMRTNARGIAADSTKIASMKIVGDGKHIDNCAYIPTGLHHTGEEGECDWQEGCDMCSALYCVFPTPEYPDLPPPGGGGGSFPDPPPPNAPPPGGGGSGGGGCSTCPTTIPTCDEPFYLISPCGPGGPLPPEGPGPTFNPGPAALITIDTSISNNYPCLTTLLKEMPNCNSETQKLMYNAFGKKTSVNLHFQIGNFPANSLDEAEATPGKAQYVLLPNGNWDSTMHYDDTILINPHMLSRVAKEYLVSVLYHEAIHAVLNWEIERYARQEVDSNYIKTNYPIFWSNLFTNYYNSQHEHMATSYINTMAALIKLYYPPNAPDSVRTRVANSMAWGGLHMTTAWKQRGQDTCRIDSDIKAASNYATPQTYTTPSCGSITKSAITDLKLTAPCL